MTTGGGNAVSSGAVKTNSVMTTSCATTISAALISVGRWGVQRLEREREVFLRAMIEFWLCQVCQYVMVNTIVDDFIRLDFTGEGRQAGSHTR